MSQSLFHVCNYFYQINTFNGFVRIYLYEIYNVLFVTLFHVWFCCTKVQVCVLKIDLVLRITIFHDRKQPMVSLNARSFGFQGKEKPHQGCFTSKWVWWQINVVMRPNRSRRSKYPTIEINNLSEFYLMSKSLPLGRCNKHFKSVISNQQNAQGNL